MVMVMATEEVPTLETQVVAAKPVEPVCVTGAPGEDCCASTMAGASVRARMRASAIAAFSFLNMDELLSRRCGAIAGRARLAATRAARKIDEEVVRRQRDSGARGAGREIEVGIQERDRVLGPVTVTRHGDDHAVAGNPRARPHTQGHA